MIDVYPLGESAFFSAYYSNTVFPRPFGMSESVN